MAVKRLITEAEHKALDPKLQAEYKAGDTGTMVLDLTDYEDPAVLKRAKDLERDAGNAAKKLLKTATDELAVLTEERDNLLKSGVPKDNVEKLELSYKKKLADREKELQTQIDSANASLQTTLVDNVATTMANEISTAPSLILPHIAKRLKVEQVDGKFITRVLDEAGAPSAATVEDLKKELSLRKEWAAVITGSKASGGGAGGSKGGGGAGAGKIDWKASPADIAKSLAASGRIKTD